jgi:hypothetical protein
MEINGNLFAVWYKEIVSLFEHVTIIDNNRG